MIFERIFVRSFEAIDAMSSFIGIRRSRFNRSRKNVAANDENGTPAFLRREIDRRSLGRRTFVFYRASPSIERSSALLRAKCSTLPEGRGG